MLSRVDFDVDGSIGWYWGFALGAPPRRASVLGIAAAALIVALLVARAFIWGAVVFVAWQFARQCVVVGEHLIVTPRVGVEVATVYLCGRVSRKATAADCISDVVINEAMQRCSVRCFVAIVAADDCRVLVPFQHVRPSVRELAVVSASIRACLGISHD